MIGSYCVAALLPALGMWVRRTTLGGFTFSGADVTISLPLLMLASLLFNAGLGVRVSELKRLILRPYVPLGGVAANLAVPLAFIAGLSVVMSLWHNPEEVQQILVGLALVASMPIAGSSTAWAQNSNGNLSLSLGLVLITTVLSPLLTPLVLHFVGLLTTGDYSEDLHELADGGVGTFLGVWVILPSLAGIVARWVMGERVAARTRPTVKLVNHMILLILNYSNASLSLPEVIANPDYDFLVVMVAIALGLCGIAFAAGWLLSRALRVTVEERVSLMFGLGMNNNGTGLVLASMALADHPQVMLPIIFYNLVQHLVAATVDRIMFRQRGDA